MKFYNKVRGFMSPKLIIPINLADFWEEKSTNIFDVDINFLFNSCISVLKNKFKSMLVMVMFIACEAISNINVFFYD